MSYYRAGGEPTRTPHAVGHLRALHPTFRSLQQETFKCRCEDGASLASSVDFCGWLAVVGGVRAQGLQPQHLPRCVNEACAHIASRSARHFCSARASAHGWCASYAHPLRWRLPNTKGPLGNRVARIAARAQCLAGFLQIHAIGSNTPRSGVCKGRVVGVLAVWASVRWR